MKELPIIVRADGLYLDLDRLGRGGAEEPVDEFVLQPDAAEEPRSKRANRGALVKYDSKGFVDPDDALVPGDMRVGIFEPPTTGWQDSFDLDEADRRGQQMDAKEARWRLVREIKRRGVDLPPLFGYDDESDGVTLRLTTDQAMAIADMLCRQLPPLRGVARKTVMDPENGTGTDEAAGEQKADE